jgi:hypothetical protein
VEQIICVLCNASDEPKATFQRPQARFGGVRLESLIRMLSLTIYSNEDD